MILCKAAETWNRCGVFFMAGCSVLWVPSKLDKKKIEHFLKRSQKKSWFQFDLKYFLCSFKNKMLFRIWSWTHHNRSSRRRRWRLCGFNVLWKFWRLLSLLCLNCVFVVTVATGVLLNQQMWGDVPQLSLWGPPAVVKVVNWGLFRAAASLVLPPEAPEFGAPVFPPLEGQSGAVRHQATLLRTPAPLPFLGADQQERPTHVEGRAAAAQISVRHPKGLGTLADSGVGPRPENHLYEDGKLPPGTWTLHFFNLDLQHWQTHPF